MKESRYIVKYLKEIEQVASHTIGYDESELIKLLRRLAEYHESGLDGKGEEPTDYLYRQLAEAPKGNQTKKQFNVQSILYLLERRRIIIHDNTIFYDNGEYVLPILSPTVQAELAMIYDLDSNELRAFGSNLTKIDMLLHYKELGDEHNATIPNDYDESSIAFKDITVSRKTFKQVETNDEMIPASRMPVNSNQHVTKQTPEDIKRILMMIADYNDNNYRHLLKILAYGFTRPYLEKMFVFTGKGRNGKGLFLSMMQAYYGSEAFAITTMTSFGKNGNSSTKDSGLIPVLTSRVTLVQEERQITRDFFDSTYKNYTTGGTELTRSIGSNAKTVQSRTTFMVATNEYDFSDFQADDFSVDNRMIPTEFTNKFIDSRADAEIAKHDNDIILESMKGMRQFQSLPIFQLLTQELNEADDLTQIKGSIFDYRKSDTIVDKIYSAVQEQPDLLVAENGVIKLNCTKMYGIVASEAIIWKELEGVRSEFIADDKLDMINGTDVAIVFKDEKEQMLFFKGFSRPDDFSFNDKVDINKLRSVSKERIRVTEAFYKLGLTTFDKDELTDYVSVLDGFEVTYIEKQPFMVSLVEAIEEPEPDLEDLTGQALLDALAKDHTPIEELKGEELLNALLKINANKPKAKEVEIELKPVPVSQSTDFNVSVFDGANGYPSGDTPRMNYTQDIESLVTDASVTKKDNTLKFFPYGIEHRSDDTIVASRWLGMDFDTCNLPDNIDDVVDTFKGTGYDVFIQESFSSLKECKKCGKCHVKFHALVRTSLAVNSESHKPATERFMQQLWNINGLNVVIYQQDPNYRYNSIMNCGNKPWHHIIGKLFDMSDFGGIKVHRAVSDTETLGDFSHVKSFQDYLLLTQHGTGKDLFDEMTMHNVYADGNRDNFVFNACKLIEQCYNNYQVSQGVCEEGYDMLRRIIATHPRQEGKQQLLHKVDRSERGLF